MDICNRCGQLKGIPEYDEKLWDLYNRIDDGRSTWEPLVYTSDWVQENIHDEDDHDAMMLSMEKDMYYRGLCPGCARPNLTGVNLERIMTEEDAREMQDMWAEQAAERRMGA
jgi:hypothetical protein